MWRRKRRALEELDQDIREHIASETRDNIERGMSAEEARYAALRKFGNVTQAKEDARAVWNTVWPEQFWQDIRFGARMLRKNPGFTAVAILTLAIGIGATTSVFSVVDRILFRSLPYSEGDRLVTLGFVAPPFEPLEFLPGRDYVEWKSQNTGFASMTSWTGIQNCDLTEAPAARLACVPVESTFLTTFGVEPMLGRSFTREEDRPGGPKVALMFYSLWKGRYGGDPAIVGKSISLDGQLTTILGVLPRDFELPNLTPADFLVPLSLNEAALNRSDNGPEVILRVFARLKPGISIVQAKASLESSFQESLQLAPPSFRSHIGLSVRSLREREIGDARLASWVLLGFVLAVLLIACANVANLLLSRAAARHREFAVRAALGAGRARLIRQSLTESALLAFGGAAVGCALAVGLLRVFLAISPQGIPRLRDATLDLRVLALALAASIASGIFFGLVSAQHDVPTSSIGRTSSVHSRRFLRRLLVTAQIAVSFVLLAGAGLLPRAPHGAGGIVTWSSVTPGYFPTLAIPIIEGRGFTDADRAPDVHDIVLSESLARRLFPGEDALGKNIRWTPESPWQTIIGVAGDVKYVQDNGFVQSADPEYYVARKRALPDAWSFSSVILRTSLNPATVGSWMRSVVASLDPAVPVTINTMGHRVEQLEARPRFDTALLGIFAAMGLLLAAVGTYGILSFFVAQRTREIGVRTALGAQSRDIMKLVVTEGAILTLLGIAVGIAGAIATTRLMTAMLFGVSATDTMMFVGVTILLAIAALLACWIPARRATRVDPMVALRHE